jgi:DNA polymerase-3 subunit beta
MIKISNLSPVLSILGIAAGKTPMPILKCIKVEADNNKMNMTASNLEMQIEYFLDCEVIKPMSFCADADKLAQFAKVAGKNEIEIKFDKEKLSLKSKSRSNINFMPVENFPAMLVSTEGSVSVTIDAETFSNAINYTSISVAVNHTSIALNGFYIAIKDGFATITTSDSKRLSQSKIPVNYDGEIECVIPKQSALTIAKLFQSGDIEIVLNRNSLSIESDNIKLISKNIDAKYPIFNKIFYIPTVPAQIESSDFINCIEAGGINSDSRYMAVVLNFSKNEIGIESFNENGEQSSSEVECQFSGDISVGFCKTLLIDAAKKIEGAIELDICSQFITMKNDNKNNLQLVMSMRM